MSEQDKISSELNGIKWASIAGAAAQAAAAQQASKQTQLLTQMLEGQEKQAELERQRRSEIADGRRLLVKLEMLCATVEHLESDQRRLPGSARLFVELGIRLRQLDSSVFDDLTDLRSAEEARRRVDAISALCVSDGGATCEQQAQNAADAIAKLIHAAIQLQPPESVQIERSPVSRDELERANTALDAWAERLPPALRCAVNAGSYAIAVGAVVSGERAKQVALNSVFPPLPIDLQPLLKLIIAGAYAKMSDGQLFVVATQVTERARLQLAPYSEALSRIVSLSGEVVRACQQGNKAGAKAALKSISSLRTSIDINGVNEYTQALSVYKRRWRTGSLLLIGVLMAVGFGGFVLLVIGFVRSWPESGKLIGTNKEAPPSQNASLAPTSPSPVSTNVGSDGSTLAKTSDAGTSTPLMADYAKSSDVQFGVPRSDPLSDQSKGESLQTRFGTFSVKEGQLLYNNRSVRDRNNVLVSGDVVSLEKAISLSEADVILVHTNCAGSSCSGHGDTRFVSVTSTELNASPSFGYGRAIVLTTKATPIVTIDYGEFGKAIYNDGRIEVAPPLMR